MFQAVDTQADTRTSCMAMMTLTNAFICRTVGEEVEEDTSATAS